MDEVSRLRGICDNLGGEHFEPNPNVHVCTVAHRPGEETELVLHEDTGGEMMVRYEGEFGETAELQTNIHDTMWDGNTLSVDGAEGHITPEGGYSNHHRDVDVTVTRQDFSVSQNVI